jgi:hypothetical protein
MECLETPPRSKGIFFDRAFSCLGILLVIAALLCGCVRLALRISPSIIGSMSKGIFEECDPRLAEASLPAQLKVLEGLLRQDPSNRRLLTSLSMGFSGYALLFVEEEDPGRASTLYARARDYGLLALGLSPNLRSEALTDTLRHAELSDMDALFWTAAAWNGWIALNLDRPEALAQAGTAEVFLDKVLALQPDYFHGAPYVLKGAILTARSSLGVNGLAEARECFEKAVKAGEGRFFMAQVYFARFYAVRIQDRALFDRLIKEVLDTDGNLQDDRCLVNAVMRQRAKRLAEEAEALFY